MTAKKPKKDLEPTSGMSCISNVSQAVGNVQHSIIIMNKPLSQTSIESLYTEFPGRYVAIGSTVLCWLPILPTIKETGRTEKMQCSRLILLEPVSPVVQCK